VHELARSYYLETFKEIIIAYIILHNIIVKDEQDLYIGAYGFVYEKINESPLKPPSHEHTLELVGLIQNIFALRQRTPPPPPFPTSIQPRQAFMAST
jgi:hypothetical protein